MARPWPDQRCLFLDRSLEASSDEGAPSGIYDPVRNARNLNLGKNTASPEAVMAALHETFHAFLNSSTTYGGAMLLAGVLMEAGETQFGALVDVMVDDAREVHETYATASSIFAASGGWFDRALLFNYPSYGRYFDALASGFDLERLPILASIGLDAAARAAMQTDILQRWTSLEVAAWDDWRLPHADPPDARFRHCLAPAVCRDAAAAITGAIEAVGSSAAGLLDPGLAPREALDILLVLTSRQQETFQRAAYGVFAQRLRTAVAYVGGFEDQRSELDPLIERIKVSHGSRLKTDFVRPCSVDDDLEAIWMDHRREVLDIRAGPDLAFIGWARDYDEEVARLFIQSAAPPYVQFIAMPAAKAAVLYRFDAGSAPLDEGPPILTAFRQRLANPSGPPRTEFLRVETPEEVDALLAPLGDVMVRAIVSGSALDDPDWRSVWLTPGAGRVDELALVLDIDPFQVIEELGAIGAITIGKIGLRWGEPGAPDFLEVIVLTSAARPQVLYFTPCSNPLVGAVATFARSRGLDVTVSNDEIEARRDIILPALSHTVREEFRFGFRFWSDGALSE